MLVWVFFGFLVVLGLKYYTATQMRKLELRLSRVKKGLQKIKQSYQDTQDQQHVSKTEEEQFTERIRYMKEIILDIQGRLAGGDDAGAPKPSKTSSLAQ